MENATAFREHLGGGWAALELHAEGSSSDQ